MTTDDERGNNNNNNNNIRNQFMLCTGLEYHPRDDPLYSSTLHAIMGGFWGEYGYGLPDWEWEWD